MNKSSKYLGILLVLSILLNVFLGFKYLKTKRQYSPDYSYNRKELFEHLTIDSSSIVFAGNSLTAQFELAELFNNAAIRNRGINGDRSDGLLARIPTIVKSHPKKIFLEIGINDIGQGIDKTTLLGNYTKILEEIQQQSGTSKIYVQSILPVLNAGPAITSSAMKNETIRDVNKSLAEYCKAHNITFIDLNDKFQVNGEIDPRFCIADGLHISGEGYQLWAKLIKEYVNE